MCEAQVRHLGVSVEGRLLWSLHYADDTALCINSHHEADELINRVNDAGTRRLLKLNVKKTKLVINDSEDPILRVRGEAIERVTNFKYLGSVRSGTGYCDKDIEAQFGMAKKRMLELTNIWNDKAAPIKTPQSRNC